MDRISRDVISAHSQSGLLDAELGCDLIGGAEADAADFGAEILRDPPVIQGLDRHARL